MRLQLPLLRRVVGVSMLPTLQPGQWLLFVPGVHIAMGDIVVAMAEGREVVKRVAWINQQQVYLLGDNAGHSTDSRNFGLLPRAAIRGRLWLPGG